jgi:aldehyde dehydrogenase (NAD+)
VLAASLCPMLSSLPASLPSLNAGKMLQYSLRAVSCRRLHTGRFLINNEWVHPAAGTVATAVINPANGKSLASLALGNEQDLGAAVAAARHAFDTWSESSIEVRIDLLKSLASIYKQRSAEMAKAICEEMGAPIKLATTAQVGAGLGHIQTFIKVLDGFPFEEQLDAHSYLRHEPIGVCGLITPWNWPMNQVTLKVIPALASGNTVVLKPSEVAPLSSLLFAEMIVEAGFPPGVFNLVNGRGDVVGDALARHPHVDAISFTGSTRAGASVTKAAADTVKRVTLELGGKGPNLIFADVGEKLRDVVKKSVRLCFINTGQSCNAPTRMLVERSVYDEAVEVAVETASQMRVGDPAAEGSHIGPVASGAQYSKVQELIASGVDDGARLLVGGLGPPSGLPDGHEGGFFVRPTVFADVKSEMRIAREEIFGPVLSIAPFDNEDDGVRIANDTLYGLTSYVQTGSDERARRVARKLRAGMVEVNFARRSGRAPFGGMRQSGNGREGGEHGLREFLEVKAISGWPSCDAQP